MSTKTKSELRLRTDGFECLIRLSLSIDKKEINFTSLDRLINYFINHLPNWLSHFQHFLSLRPHSLDEIKKYLDGKLAIECLQGSKKEFYSLLLKKMVAEGIINSDEEFITFWLRSRSSATPRSLAGIKYELYQHGLEHSLVDQVINHLQSQGDYDELVALKLLYRRYRHKSWQKFYQAAKRHRFRSETIKRLLDEIKVESQLEDSF